MADSISWGQVPEGFDKIRSGGRMALVRGDMATHLDLQRLRDTEVEDNGVFGRGALAVLRLDGGDALVRPYHHGGALRAFTGDYFLTWPPRPFRELALTEAARRRGVPTVEVLAAIVEPVGGPVYRGWLVTRRLQDARDLWAAAQADAPDAKRADWQAAARAGSGGWGRGGGGGVAGVDSLRYQSSGSELEKYTGALRERKREGLYHRLR